jgi:hypothetical protein
MKKLINKRAVFGCFPKPVGGVSNFIYRLAEKNMVALVVDSYPNAKKSIPDTYLGEVVELKNKFALFSYIITKCKCNTFFFNFSTVKSLLFVKLIPKYGRCFELMLHNGIVNKQNFPDYLVRFLLNKFDVVYAIGEIQYAYYRKLKLRAEIVKTSSLLLNADIVSVPGLILNNDNGVILKPRREIIAFSGNARPEYNLYTMLRYAMARDKYVFYFFLYDIEECEYEKIKSEYRKENIVFFRDLSNRDMLSFLKKCTHLIRPTLVDSFGLVTAEAIENGVSVLATDVCVRYQGVYTYTHSDSDFTDCCDSFIEGRLSGFNKSDAEFFQFEFLE